MEVVEEEDEEGRLSFPSPILTNARAPPVCLLAPRLALTGIRCLTNVWVLWYDARTGLAVVDAKWRADGLQLGHGVIDVQGTRTHILVTTTRRQELFAANV